MKNNHLKILINKFRAIQANNHLYTGSILLINLFIILFLIILFFESTFYFSSISRTKFIQLYITLFFIGVFYLLIRWYIFRNNINNNASDQSLAILLQYKIPKLKDRLINALQLENQLTELNHGHDLAKLAIKRINNSLNSFQIQKLSRVGSIQLLKNLIISFFLFLLVFLIKQDSFSNALIRLVNPKTNFQIPTPFKINSLVGNQSILSGDSITVFYQGFGALPDSINIIWKNFNDSGKVMTPLNNQEYKFTFSNLNFDTKIKAIYYSKKWLSPWKDIRSKTDTIFVTHRPIIEEINFSIIPPKYTQINEINHSGNKTDLYIPEGSKIKMDGVINKPIKNAWIEFSDYQKTIVSYNTFIEDIFTIQEDTKASFHCIDYNNVTNKKPPNYNFHIIPDDKPEVILYTPQEHFELDESDYIYFNFHASDDYGFSNCLMEYNIITPTYLKPDTTTYKQNINEFDFSIRNQQILHEWNISNLNLAPEDELHIYLIVEDNNIFSGPSKTKSSLIVGKYPSLEELYKRLEDDESEIHDYSQNIQSSIDEVKEIVEEIELEFLKSENVSWEEEQKTNQVVEKMEEIFSEIDEMNEVIKKIEDQSEKNNLVSKDMIEKFSHFQSLLNEMMTPELVEAMEKLQSAMQEMDPEKIMDALENFEFSLEEFEKQLDRFIDMFERAIAEQAMEELLKNIEELTYEQNSILEELNKPNPSLNDLASRERRQEEKFIRVETKLLQASKSLEGISFETSESLNKLSESELISEIQSQLNNARKSMQNSENNNAQNYASEASDNLQDLLDELNKINNQFKEKTVDEMLRYFLALMKNLLSISERQELLISNSTDLRSNSPKLIETAVLQNHILRENNQLMVQLIELSNQTFHITPEIGRSIGKTKSSMMHAISKLEQKQTTSAKKDMNTALEGLNKTGYLLIMAANEMQNSGSASGYASYMESLAEMSQEQEGINQGTSMMPQLGMMGQQKMMQQLQEKQEKLMEKLKDLIGSNPSIDENGLSQASKEMEDVINDFRKRQINRETKERQQRILSRMLDSQKSLKQKDYSEKRKSKKANAFDYAGPGGLPENLGAREMLLMKAMDSALEEDFSIEYQIMIKNYFRNLQNEFENNE